MKTFLVIGACGSGKTWIMQQLVKKFKLDVLGKVGMFYFHYNDKMVVLGKYDGSTFQGSDRLSMAIMRDLPKFKVWAKDKIVVCEGDRFMNETFVQGLRPHISIIGITDDGKKGRKKRKSNQTERQIKTIQTRVSNMMKMAKHQVADSDEALRVLLSELK